MKATNERTVIRMVLEENAAASAEAEAGAVVCCSSGKLWLTQEGDAHDYVVPAGMAFHCARGGRVVMSGLEPGTVVVVRNVPAPAARVHGVHIASLDALVRAARAAQARHVAAALERAGTWAMRAARRVLAASWPVRARRVPVPAVGREEDCCA